MKRLFVFKRKSETFQPVSNSENLAEWLGGRKLAHKKLMRKLDSNNIKRQIRSRKKRKLFYQNSEYFNGTRLAITS